MTALATLKQQLLAARGQRFRTNLSLWIPDEHSAVGRHLAPLRRVAKLIPWRLPQGLSFSRVRGLFKRAPNARRWTAGFATLAPSDVHDLLTERLPTPNALRVAIEKGGAVTYHLVLGEIAFARRRFDRATGIAHNDLLMVDPAHQGGGIATHVLANAVALYRRLGITRIELTAGLSHGSAVWPRLGYRPVDEAEWDALRQRF